MTQHSTVTKQFYNKAVSKLQGLLCDKNRRIKYLERCNSELRQEVERLKAELELYRDVAERFNEEQCDE